MKPFHQSTLVITQNVPILTAFWYVKLTLTKNTRYNLAFLHITFNMTNLISHITIWGRSAIAVLFFSLLLIAENSNVFTIHMVNIPVWCPYIK